jgi:hypothetical protein
MKYRQKNRLITAVVVAGVFMYVGYGAILGMFPFVAHPHNAGAMPYQGAGGDPALLDVLVESGVKLSNISSYSLDELRATLEKNPINNAAQFIIYRGEVRQNLLRRGLSGFLVCSYSRPYADGILRNADGLEFACAVTDRNGLYTFVGLPRDVEITFTTARGGFLQLAFTTRLSLPQNYQQDYIGSVPVYLMRGQYQRDPRYPFCIDGGCSQGDMVITIVNEYRSETDPFFGYGTEGMYFGNGVSDVTVQIYTDPNHDGTFASPYPNLVTNNPESVLPDTLPDGMVYSGTMIEDINYYSHGKYDSTLNVLSSWGMDIFLTQQEYPQLWRTETSAFGLALMKNLEPGIYEAEVTHPTLTCYPTKDAWISSSPNRVRFEIIPGTLGDIRFYCER